LASITKAPFHTNAADEFCAKAALIGRLLYSHGGAETLASDEATIHHRFCSLQQPMYNDANASAHQIRCVSTPTVKEELLLSIRSNGLCFRIPDHRHPHCPTQHRRSIMPCNYIACGKYNTGLC
jgi:hypothetical protein